MPPAPPNVSRNSLIGTLCGVGAAACWAASFVAARYGVQHGFAPADLVLYRFVPPGLVLLPLMVRDGLADLGGITWPRGILLAVLGGPVQALCAYSGYTLVPLGHGAVIQPACAVLGGLALAAWLLNDRLSRQRLVGAVVMITGLVLFAGEAITTIGRHGLAGDLMFVAGGLLWAFFGTALKAWSVSGPRAASAVSVVALFLYTPVHAFLYGYDHILAVSLFDNMVQLLVQGLFAAALPIYLFTRALILLGASRGAVFTALVPCFALVIGAATIGEIPTALQLAGLAVVISGFRLAIKA
ncbi:MAG TPA: DMT family transporter [Pseudorhodoplanes sp.]|nr:DMT family transporter [Pseudorhodoplanes sp.]